MTETEESRRDNNATDVQWQIREEEADTPSPSNTAEAVFIMTESDTTEPTPHAEVELRFREINPSPTTKAEAWFKYLERMDTGVTVPGEHASQMLDLCLRLGGGVGIAAGPRLTLEWTNATMPPWLMLGITLAQIIGLAALVWGANR